MSYPLRFSLFLLVVMIVAGALGYVSAFFGPWVCVLVILVMIPLSIEVGRKVLKRDRL
jgi:1,4-dihydroxy-2-naphthoate octaprenyltransferase